MDELAGQQAMIRVGNGRARHDGAGVAIHRILEERQRSRISLAAFIRNRRLRWDRLCSSIAAEEGEIALAWVEGDINRVQLNQGVQLRAGGADQRALMYQTPADPTGKGCAQFGVAEIEPRCLNGGVVGLDLRF